jgi:GT2 family glycosyltransferase
VVDNGSADDTVAVVRRHHPDVALVALDANYGCGARNIGVGLVDTPYVAFVDDDTWPDPEALGRAEAVLDAHPEVAVVAARTVVEPAGHDDPTCALMAGSQIPTADGLPGRAIVGFLAGGSVIRKCAFEAVGGFDPSFGIGGEEELLAFDLIDAGWSLLYVAQVVVRHQPSLVRNPASRRRGQARNRIRVAWLRRTVPDATRITLEEFVRAGKEAPRLVVDLIRAVPELAAGRRPVSRETTRLVRLATAAQSTR